METRVYIALGSNIGDREHNIRGALDQLGKLAIGECNTSSLYRTDPQDMEDDAEEFVNAATTFVTELAPRSLLAALKEIEMAMGRPADHGKNISRPIDLDMIAFGETVLESETLTLPHPRAMNRLFVLMPLVEIAPDLVLPGCRVSVRERFAELMAVGPQDGQ